MCRVTSFRPTTAGVWLISRQSVIIVHLKQMPWHFWNGSPDYCVSLPRFLSACDRVIEMNNSPFKLLSAVWLWKSAKALASRGDDTVTWAVVSGLCCPNWEKNKPQRPLRFTAQLESHYIPRQGCVSTPPLFTVSRRFPEAPQTALSK